MRPETKDQLRAWLEGMLAHPASDGTTHDVETRNMRDWPAHYRARHGEQGGRILAKRISSLETDAAGLLYALAAMIEAGWLSYDKVNKHWRIRANG